MLITATFTAAGQVSGSFKVKRGDGFSMQVGTGVGAIWIEIEYSPNLQAWTLLPRTYNYTFVDGVGDFERQYFIAEKTGHYRAKCTAYALGTYPLYLRTEPRELETVKNNAGQVVWQITEDGVSGLQRGTIYTGGNTAGQVVKSMGTDEDEGFLEKIIEEEIDLTGAGAVFVNLTSTVPQGALLRSIQCVITDPITDDTGRVKVGIGPVADPDQYGLTADNALLSAANSDPFPDGSTPLAGALQLRVNGCQTNGDIATENFTDGAVRVRVLYEQLVDLHDAIINFP